MVDRSYHKGRSVVIDDKTYDNSRSKFKAVSIVGQDTAKVNQSCCNSRSMLS